MKRLLAAGYGDCYELGRVFRQAESGHLHNPEFTMLEWYRSGWSWRRLAEEVIAFVQQAGANKFANYKTCWISYTDIFKQATGLNPITATKAQLDLLLNQHQIDTNSSLTVSELLDLAMAMLVQKKLPHSQLTVLYEFPLQQAALACPNPDKPETALRFEVYLGKIEIANGYQELTDVTELEQRMLADNQQRTKAHLATVPIDRNLLNAQLNGLPECAGVALGFDRLLMIIIGLDDIADCLAFDFKRA